MAFDVVVVGARAAGAATAMLLARLGHDVVLVDRATFPADTVSTHQIARSGVVQLHRWGVLDSVLASGAPALRQVTFTAEGDSATRVIADKAGVDFLVAPRRYILDTVMIEASVRSGVQLRQGVVVTRVGRDATGRATGVHGYDAAGRPVDIHARFVVGADGLGSTVARSVGAGVVDNRHRNGAVQYAYFADVDWCGLEFFVADRALAGVFPTHHGEACVWIGTPAADAHAARRRSASRAQAFTAVLTRTAPELTARLREGRRTSPVSGMLRMPNILRAAHGAGWALVGDAGYHRDALTGYGLSDAYRDAEILAVALHRALRGDVEEMSALAAYQSDRDRRLRSIFELTCALAEYPPPPRFVELQKALGRAIDNEAAALANPGEFLAAGV
jgi:2-polyprenyl-6-methoxyphenol hydroxylase-like FAD-dependent oxidoreductase